MTERGKDGQDMTDRLLKCPVCFSKDYYPSTANQVHGNYECTDCRSFFNPDAKPFDYADPKYFQEGNEGNEGASGYEDYAVNREVRYAQGIAILRRHNELMGRGRDNLAKMPKGKILEIGAAYGFLLWPFLQMGWEVFAVEPNTDGKKHLAKMMQEYDQQRTLGAVDQLDHLISIVGGPFLDIAIAFDVLEHLQQPRMELEALRTLMRPGGTLLVHVPNLHRYQEDPNHRHWAKAQHIIHFTPESMARMLIEAGFNVLQKEEGMLDGQAPLADVDSMTFWAMAR